MNKTKRNKKRREKELNCHLSTNYIIIILMIRCNTERNHKIQSSLEDKIRQFLLCQKDNYLKKIRKIIFFFFSSSRNSNRPLTECFPEKSNLNEGTNDNYRSKLFKKSQKKKNVLHNYYPKRKEKSHLPEAIYLAV